MSTLAPAEEDKTCCFVLRGHLINVWEILYCPFVTRAIEIGVRSGDASLMQELVEKGLQVHVDRIDANCPGFSHRHHGIFGMIKSCIRGAFVVLAAASSLSIHGQEQGHRQQPYNMRTGRQQSIEEVMWLLEFWKHESSDFSTMVVLLRQLFLKCQVQNRLAGNAFNYLS